MAKAKAITEALKKTKSLKENRSLKESNGIDVLYDLIDRAKGWVDDGDDAEEAVRHAIDDGLIYTEDIVALGLKYGAIDDSEIINNIYEELFDDMYKEVSDYANEELTKTYHITSITWDVEDDLEDGQTYEQFIEEEGLPTQFDIEIEYKNGQDPEDVLEDAISDEYGWLYKDVKYDVEESFRGIKPRKRGLRESVDPFSYDIAEKIARKIKKVGMMGFEEVDNLILDMYDGDLREIEQDVFTLLNYEGINTNYSTGDFYTDEYAKEQPEVLEESKKSKRHGKRLKESLIKKFDKVVDVNDEHANNEEFLKEVTEILGPEETYGGSIEKIKDFKLDFEIRAFDDGVRADIYCEFKALIDGDFDDDVYPKRTYKVTNIVWDEELDQETKEKLPTELTVVVDYDDYYNEDVLISDKITDDYEYPESFDFEMLSEEEPERESKWFEFSFYSEDSYPWNSWWEKEDGEYYPQSDVADIYYKSKNNQIIKALVEVEGTDNIFYIIDPIEQALEEYVPQPKRKGRKNESLKESLRRKRKLKEARNSTDKFTAVYDELVSSKAGKTPFRKLKNKEEDRYDYSQVNYDDKGIIVRADSEEELDFAKEVAKAWNCETELKQDKSMKHPFGLVLKVDEKEKVSK